MRQLLFILDRSLGLTSPVNLLSFGAFSRLFAWVVFVDTEIDGGGICGVSQLIIFNEIMKRIQAKKQLTKVPKPCEYFHLIGGSGTGG